jgi:hypothetical protein
VNFTDSLGLLDIYARGGAAKGQWVYEVQFYTNLAETYEREIGRTFISRLDRIKKIVDWVWGKRTGVSDLEKFADRWKCDKGDKVAKKIYDEMFPNRYTISEEEFRNFMDAFLEAVPELSEFYNVDQMIQLANKRGRRLPGQ